MSLQRMRRRCLTCRSFFYQARHRAVSLCPACRRPKPPPKPPPPPKPLPEVVHTIMVDFPDDALRACGQDPEAFVRTVREAVYLVLFGTGKLSAGRAARLCGVSRTAFLAAASRARIPVADLDEEEMKREFQDA